MRRYLVAIGGNVPFEGHSGEKLLQPVVELIKSDSSFRANPHTFIQSPWYRTPAFPAGSGPDFVNGALALESPLEPHIFLENLHAIETRFGRERADRWGARTVDLDLIACDDAIFPNHETWAHWYNLPLARQLGETPDELILPHPRLQNRAFVLVPLNDIAPDWRHPVLDKNIAEMHAELTETDRAEVRLL